MPEKLAHWIPKEVQNMKNHARHAILCLLLSVIVKNKVKVSAGLGLDARACSNFVQPESGPQRSLKKGTMTPRQQKVPLVTKTVVSVRVRGKDQETTESRGSAMTGLSVCESLSLAS